MSPTEDIGTTGRPAVPTAFPPTDPGLPAPALVEVPIGRWTRDPTHPAPITAAALAARRSAARGTAAVHRELGVLLDGVQTADIGGRLHTRAVPIDGVATSPAWRYAVLVRTAPALRRRARAARHALATDLPGRLLQQWWYEGRAEFGTRAAAVLATDPAALDDPALLRHLDDALALVAEGGRWHARLRAAVALVLDGYLRTCHDLLGWDDGRALALLAGTASAATAPARDLDELARTAARRAPVRAAFERGAHAATVLAEDPVFARAAAAYLREHGTALPGGELAEPGLAEDPHLLVELLRDRLGGCPPPRPLSGTSDGRRDLAGIAQRRFYHRLDRAMRAHGVPADVHVRASAVPLGLLRRCLLEIGARLAARERIARRDDVAHLEPGEAGQALLTGDRLHALVRERRGRYAWALARPAPAAYGDPPPPPPRTLPRAARAVDRALRRLADDAVEPAGPYAAALVGVAASPGSYRGPVRVMRAVREFPRLRPGEVLVCAAPTPIWSILVARAGALVTDAGGVLSHPAVLAREFGVPAVVGTGRATAKLVDGQVVVVDGTAGTVDVR